VQETFSVPAARPAFWIAIVLGGIGVAAAFFMPVEGALSAALCFGVAWGIRRGQAWAAVTLACVLLEPVVAALLRIVENGSAFNALSFAVGLPIALALAYWPVRAALNLCRRGEAQRPWPWIAVLLACVCFWLGFRPYMMNSGSMEDTILPGDYLLVETATWSMGRAPALGDIVTLRYPVDRKQIYVKRVVGLPGDRLRIVNKQLFRNGAAVPEPYATHKTAYVDAYRDNFPSEPPIALSDSGARMLRENVRNGEVIVPQGQYFVLGDSRDISLDSRYWGFCPRRDILGSPCLIYGSYDLKGALPPKSLPTVFKTRWNRLFRTL
jgi:signal peptidase I